MGRVQTARHDGLLRRLFSIKGEGSLLPETLGDLFPTLDIENTPIELLRLSGWELGIAGTVITSAVGETAGIQLLNPAGSGKIIVPTTFHLNFGAATIVFMGVSDVALATATVGRQRDTREGVTARTSGIVRVGVDTIPPVGAIRLRFNANEPRELSDQNGLAVLAPGTALTFVTIGLNATAQVGVIWRERTAEPSELSF